MIRSHALSQSELQSSSQQDARLPFSVIHDCTYCFDSVDDEQDVEEGSVQHSKPLGAQDALYVKLLNLTFFNLNLQPNSFSVRNPAYTHNR